MRRFAALLALSSTAMGAVLGTVPVHAQDGAGKSFKPESAWSLDYGDDYCRLARSFSDGKESLALALERIQPGPFMRVVLVGDAVETYRRASTIGWHFTPGDTGRESPYTKSRTPDGRQMLNLGQTMLTPMAPPAPGTAPAPPPPYDRSTEQQQAKGKTGMLLDGGLTDPVTIGTEDLEAPIAALQACADDLAASWGIDAAKLKTQQSPAMPQGGGAGWLPQGTIGFDDFSKFADGSNQVRLMVSPEGKPTSCHIHWPVLDKGTNEKICSILMEKADFIPAKDAAGQAMAGYFISSPMFLLPPFGGGRGR